MSKMNLWILLFSMIIISCSKKVEVFENNGNFSIKNIHPLKTSIDEEITIIGEGFHQNITVVFNGFDGSYTNPEAKVTVAPINAKTIKVKVPKGARSGKIKLQNSTSEIVSSTIFSVNNTWRKISDFPGGIRYNATSFSHNKYGYLGLGLYFTRATGTRDFYKDFWKYDSETDTWKQVADFPGNARDNATSVKVKNKMYIGFGSTPTTKFTHNDMYVFDMDSEIWKQTSNMPYVIPSSMNTISNPGTYVEGDDIYFIGGNLQILLINLANKSVYKYNTKNDNWTLYDDGIVDGLYQVQSHTINNERIFIGGAKIAGGLITPYKLNNIDSNGKVAISNFGSELPMFGATQLVSGPISFTYKDKLFYGLGKADGILQSKIAKLENNNWSFIAEFPGVEREGASVFTINDKAYVGGGFIGGQTNGIDAAKDFYEYTIED